MEGNDRSSVTTPLPRHRRLSTQSLARAIFAAESPEQVVASLPAESLYCIIRAQGVSSSVDLIELLSAEQLRACLDFDLWSRDRFDEQALFEWLELPDAAGEIEIVGRVLRSLDLRLLGILTARYLTVKIFDEPTEDPPAGGFATPDKGFTWIRVGANEELVESESPHLTPHNEFLLQRLLALIFETSTELFYQILAIPSVATPSQLEEEALQDKEKRIQSLGIPDRDFAAALNTPLSAKRLIASEPTAAIEHSDIDPIDPLLAAASFPSTVLEQLVTTEEQLAELDAEITLLINAAIVHFNRDWHDVEQVQETARFVAGAIRIGLEALSELDISPHDSWKQFGGQRSYAVGLYEILSLRRRSLKIHPDWAAIGGHESLPGQVLTGLRERLPRCPAGLLGEYNTVLPTGSRAAELRPFESLQEVRRVEELLSTLVPSELPPPK